MNQVIAWVLLSKSYLYVYFNAYIHAMHHLAEYLNKVSMRKRPVKEYGLIGHVHVHSLRELNEVNR